MWAPFGAMIYRLTAENCREAAYKMAPQAPYLASAAVLYNSLGRRPSTHPGGVSRSRIEPLGPRAKSPAAPSTLSPEGAVNLREYSLAPLL